MLSIKEKKDVVSEKILELNQKYGTPFYLYERNKIKEQCQSFRYITYPYKDIHFATMANPHPELLSIVREQGIKVFVNSIEHLKLAFVKNYRSEDIIFTASAMDRATMHQLYKLQIFVNLDSLGQIRLWNEVTGKAPYGIRCNIGDTVKPKKSHAGYFIGKESRLGLLPEEIKQLKGCQEVTGLHLYVGTDIMDTEYFLNCYKELTHYIDFFPCLQYLDFGGGFGLTSTDTEERFNLREYGEKLTELMQKLSYKYKRNFKLILEPGRVIGGAAGHFICTVNDVKLRNSEQLIGVNASSNQFPRPLFYPDTATHPVQLLKPPEKEPRLLLSSVYGCSTYSRDFLMRKHYLPEVRVGDLLIFDHAGSYCASLYTEF